MEISVKEINYHRNGISGEGFYIVHFSFLGGDVKEPNMMAIVFDSCVDGENMTIAVLEMDKRPDTRFFYNSWRGDLFAPAILDAIRKEAAR